MQTKHMFSLVVLALTLGCSDDETAECGNGRIDASEQCDGAALNDETCADLAFTGGELSCTRECELDTSACIGTTCGNGELDTGEDCEGDELNGTTCEGLGLTAGTLACDDLCEFDVTGCGPPPRCGNGQRDSEEMCEADDLDGQSCTALGYDGGELLCNEHCRFDLSGCSGCGDDVHEPNDDPADAVALGTGSHALEMCNLDGTEVDWFAVNATAGDSLVVMVRAVDSTFGFSSGLTDDAGAAVGSMESVTDGQAWIFSAATSATVNVWVAPALARRGVGSYALEVLTNPACTGDLDCSGSQLCQDFACEDSTCTVDNDCPVDFLCHQSGCVACVTDADCGDPTWLSCTSGRCSMSCAADAHEPNDTFDNPATISVGFAGTGLSLCGDEDWYQVTLADGQRYLIDANFSHAGGDINLAVFAASDPTDLVAGGSSTTDDEHTVLAAPGGAYLVRVRQSTGVAQTYDFSVTDSGAAACLADSDCTGGGEICLGYACVVPECLVDSECTGTDRCVDTSCVAAPSGDTCASAIAVSAPHATIGAMTAHRSGVMVSGDCTPWGTEGNDAVYELTLAAGDRLLAEVTSDFDAALVVANHCAATVPGSACLAGADAVIGGGTERLEVVIEAGGTYFVVVDSFTPGYPEDGSFTLTLSVD